jgi:hypothetical protein
VSGVTANSDAVEKNEEQPEPGLTVSDRWGRLSMVRQISLLIFVLVSFAFVVIGSILWIKISNDRLPYFAESQIKKNSEIEARLRLFLRNKDNANLRKIADMSESYQALFLPRWPSDDEVFVGNDDYPVVIGRHDDLTLWLKPLSKLSSFWELEDGFAYLITTGGMNLGSSKPDLMTSKTGVKRKEIDNFFRSGMATSAHIDTDRELGESVFVHREVKSTNVILFTISPISEIKRKRLADDLRHIGWLVCATIIVVVVGAFLVRIVVKPLKEVLDHLSYTDARSGEQKQLSELGDEIEKLNFIIRTIKQKITQIKVFMREESQIKSLVHEMMVQERLPQTIRSLSLMQAEFLGHYPRSRIRNCTSYLYLTHPKLNITDNQQICSIKLTESGTPFKDISELWVPRQEVDHLRITWQRAINNEKKRNASEHHIFVIPLKEAEIDIGLFVLRGDNIASIPAADKKWLLIVAKLFAKSVWKRTNPP